MTSPDPVMSRIGAALETGQSDKSAAAEQLEQLWAEIGAEGDPLHRCTIAHHLADLQPDPRDELTWDLRALEAAESITDERAHAAGVTGSVQAFYPSLHLNLGDVYHRLGEEIPAAEHLAKGQAKAAELGEDGYGQLIRSGLDRLAEKLSQRGV